MSRYIVSYQQHLDGEAPNYLPRVEHHVKVFGPEATLGEIHQWISRQSTRGVTNVRLNLDDETWEALAYREYAQFDAKEPF